MNWNGWNDQESLLPNLTQEISSNALEYSDLGFKLHTLLCGDAVSAQSLSRELVTL